jgi:hypothetical protein
MSSISPASRAVNFAQTRRDSQQSIGSKDKRRESSSDAAEASSVQSAAREKSIEEAAVENAILATLATKTTTSDPADAPPPTALLRLDPPGRHLYPVDATRRARLTVACAFPGCLLIIGGIIAFGAVVAYPPPLSSRSGARSSASARRASPAPMFSLATRARTSTRPDSGEELRRARRSDDAPHSPLSQRWSRTLNHDMSCGACPRYGHWHGTDLDRARQTLGHFEARRDPGPRRRSAWLLGRGRSLDATPGHGARPV